MSNNNIDSFINRLINRLGEYYGQEYLVSSSEMIKNNGTIKHAIMIRKNSENLTPSIYVDEFYESFKRGEGFSEIVAKIIQIRDANGTDKELDLSYIEKYEMIKDNLIIKLINKEYNAGILDDTPHIDFADMVVVFLIRICDPIVGEGTILLHNSLFDMWNVSLDRLFIDAKNNTMKSYSPCFMDIVDVMKEIIAKNKARFAFENNAFDDFYLLSNDSQKMYVLSNQNRWYGASVIVYDGLLKELSDSLASDLYILPSSIHELIVIPQNGDEDAYAYTNMVSEVNSLNLPKEEVLSNHAYRYRRENNLLEAII